MEFRWAEGKTDRLPQLAAELVATKIDVLVTHGTPATLAAKRATKSLPIVIATSGDAVASGLVQSLRRPDANVTGLTLLLQELGAKRLELLKIIVPGATRIAILFNPVNPAFATDIKATQDLARSMKVELTTFGVRTPAEFAGAFATIAKSRFDALIIHQDGMLNGHPRELADLARQHRLTSIGFKEYGEAGGVIGYGVDFLDMYRRAAFFVDKLLKGAQPRDLPIEQPTKFELVINLQTASALGVEVPQALLLRADQVIR